MALHVRFPAIKTNDCDVVWERMRCLTPERAILSVSIDIFVLYLAKGGILTCPVLGVRILEGLVVAQFNLHRCPRPLSLHPTPLSMRVYCYWGVTAVPWIMSLSPLALAVVPGCAIEHIVLCYNCDLGLELAGKLLSCELHDFPIITSPKSLKQFLRERLFV